MQTETFSFDDDTAECCAGHAVLWSGLGLATTVGIMHENFSTVFMNVDGSIMHIAAVATCALIAVTGPMLRERSLALAGGAATILCAMF